MLATLYGPEDAITLLLQEKANPLLKNNAGRTALDLADGIKREGAKKVLQRGMTRWQSEQAAQAPSQAVLEMFGQPSSATGQPVDANKATSAKN